ncbi:MAG: AAA family ATPase, partial [Actinobacteria bacterium]|nr:AAA family ATPase [Actinomycetota bacterium]
CCVWKPTALLMKPERTRAMRSNIISFEVDRILDDDERDLLGSFRPTLINSGRPGHMHVKIKIDVALPQEENARISRHLANVLGVDGTTGGKFQPHDLLRIAGTMNTKPDVNKPVTLGKKGRGTTLSYLESVLEDYPAPEVSAIVHGELTPEPIPAPIPREIRSLMRQRDTGDGTARYKQTHKLVRSVAEGGYTRDHALWALENHEPSISKFGMHRLASQVHASWPRDTPVTQRDKSALHIVEDLPPSDLDLGEVDEYRELLTPGGRFILHAPAVVPAIWGKDGQEVWWSPSEGLMITGITGVGKSTLAGLLVKGRMGLLDRVAGYPVVPGKKKVLYLAMDRPRQIQRALRRQFDDVAEALIDEKLVVWAGPPPSQFETDHQLLLRLAWAARADTVVVDSLKDAIPKLTSEDSSGSWNRNVQWCNKHDVEVMVLHHQRKEGNGDDAKKPKSIHDVYGSQLLTAGLGSVILLWRQNLREIEVSQLKGPAGEGNSVKLHLDNQAGTLTPPIGDEAKLAFFADPHTAKQFAQFLKDDVDVTRAEVVKAYRECLSMVETEELTRADTPEDVHGKVKNAKWFQAL